MNTPWGDLKSLDLSNLELCEKILSSDKHQLIEGLVVERFYDGIFNEMATFAQIEAMDIDTAVCLHNKEFHVFILANSLTQKLKELFELLGRKMVTHLVQYHEGDLYCCRISNGKKTTEIIEISIFLDLYYGEKTVDFTVNENVRDESRQKSAFVDHLLEYYGDSIGRKVVLPRLFINHAIQAHFRAVWNLDRIVSINGSFWVMEVKHKYPIKSGTGLKFGLNVGELSVLSSIVECGIRCFHSVIVKPIWNKETGSMYIMEDELLRTRTILLGCELDRRMFDWLNASATGISAAHTSITGNGQLRFKSIPVEGFNVIGKVNKPLKELAESLLVVMVGGGEVAISGDIYSLRVG